MLGFYAICAGTAIAGGSAGVGGSADVFVPAPADGVGVGGAAWKAYHKGKFVYEVPSDLEKKRLFFRLMRKLEMYEEQYEDASLSSQRIIEIKMDEIRAQLKTLAWA